MTISFRVARRLLVACVALGCGYAGSLQAQSGADAQKAQEKATLLRFCQQMDQSAEQTVQSIRDRTDCWKRMQLQGMGDSTVDAGYSNAVADYDAAVKSDSVRQASDALDQTLASVPRLIQARDLVGARHAVDLVLAAQPDNQRAIAFRDRIAALTRGRDLRRALFKIAGAVLVLALLFGGGAKLLAIRHARVAARQRAELAARKAMLEIVDGIGRGKLYTIEGAVFRIGSAQSDRPEEKNDLIVSDGDGFISRYHCTIVRRDGKYFLIDSSLNGTYMEDDLLDRGEHRELDDGDEFSIAGMARLKFLLI
jgi:FHA domain-containing protein